MNGIIILKFGSCVTTDTESRLKNVTSNAALLCGIEALDFNKRDASKNGSGINETFRTAVETYSTGLPKELF
jgi:hypothetical protein